MYLVAILGFVIINGSGERTVFQYVKLVRLAVVMTNKPQDA